MPRVTTVKKARKAQPACINCRAEIPAGASYKHASKRLTPYSSIRMQWCASCQPKMSQLTSGHTSDLYAVTEGLDADLQQVGSIEDVRAALQVAADGIREVAESYEEGARNIEDGFGHSTSQSEEMEERASELEEAADELEQAANEVESLENDYNEQQTAIEQLESALEELDQEDDSPEIQGQLSDLQEQLDTANEKLAEILQDAKDKAEEAAGSVSV